MLKNEAQIYYDAIHWALIELEKRIIDQPEQENFMCVLIEDYLYIHGWSYKQINEYTFSSLVKESGCPTDGSLGLNENIPEQNEEYRVMSNEYRYLHLALLAEYIKGEYLE